MLKRRHALVEKGRHALFLVLGGVGIRPGIQADGRVQLHAMGFPVGELHALQGQRRLDTVVS